MGASAVGVGVMGCIDWWCVCMDMDEFFDWACDWDVVDVDAAGTAVSYGGWMLSEVCPVVAVTAVWSMVHKLGKLSMTFIFSKRLLGRVFSCVRMAMLFSASTCEIISKSHQQSWQLITIFFTNINTYHLCSPRTFQFSYLQLKSFDSILGLYHAGLNFLLHCILHNIKPAWMLKSGFMILILISIVLRTCAHKVFSFTNRSISFFRETLISSSCILSYSSNVAFICFSSLFKLICCFNKVSYFPFQ